MIVSGRYNEAVNVDVTLSGEAFGEPVEYTYEMSLIRFSWFQIINFYQRFGLN